MAERLALLSPADRALALHTLLAPSSPLAGGGVGTRGEVDPLLALGELDDAALNEILSDARFWLRPTQLAALEDDGWIVVLLGGRGSGKTRTAAHWVIEKAQTPGTRIHLVARTAADVRDVIVRGESGIMAVSPPSFMPEYFPSLRRVTWPNGSQALAFSSVEPDALRGPQAHYTLAEELATWRPIPDASGATAWDNVKIGTRLGRNPQVMVTSTPRRTPIIRALLAGSTGITEGGAGDQPLPGSGRVSVYRTSTFDNRANLAPEYLTSLVDMYAGTVLERQELYGELVDFVEGALWTESDLVPDPFFLEDPDLSLTVIGVDPASGDLTSSATGVVVVRGTNPIWLRTTLTKAPVGLSSWTT